MPRFLPSLDLHIPVSVSPRAHRALGVAQDVLIERLDMLDSNAEIKQYFEVLGRWCREQAERVGENVQL